MYRLAIKRAVKTGCFSLKSKYNKTHDALQILFLLPQN